MLVYHLRLKSKESDWLAVRDNDVFNTPENSNKILLILKLSYDNLSSHLKKCFSYCSLFPKDYKFDRETLIRLRMAEGFLHPSTRGNQDSLEDIGNDYLRSLLSSSFFQVWRKDDFGAIKTLSCGALIFVPRKDDFGDIKKFKMHDLVHDLALSCVGNHEAMIFKASEMEADVSRIRRLRLIMEEGTSRTLSDVLNNAEKLRTIFSKTKLLFIRVHLATSVCV